MNTFRNPHGDAVPKKLELARSTEEKQSQLKRLVDFHARNAEAAPAALERLKGVVIENGNVFAESPDRGRQKNARGCRALHARYGRFRVHAMVTMILPLCSPVPKSRNASRTSASLYGPSITGASLPASNSSFM